MVNWHKIIPCYAVNSRSCWFSQTNFYDLVTSAMICQIFYWNVYIINNSKFTGWVNLTLTHIKHSNFWVTQFIYSNLILSIFSPLFMSSISSISFLYAPIIILVDLRIDPKIFRFIGWVIYHQRKRNTYYNDA